MGAEKMASQRDDERIERRRHRRFPCEGFAEVVSSRPSVIFRGKLKDISQSGCFIETRARLNLSRFAEVEVRLAAFGKRLKAHARVMDVHPGRGASFAFLTHDRRWVQSVEAVIEGLKDEETPTV